MKQSAAPKAMRLLFCGADRDWQTKTRDEIRRRHLFFLQAFIADPHIEHVYVLTRVSRLNCLKMYRPGRSHTNREASTIPLVRWLPERSWLPWTASLNRILARWLVRRQLAASSPATVVWCYTLRGMAIADYLDLEGEWFIDTDHDIRHDANRRSLSSSEAEALILRCVHRARSVFSASRNMLRWLGENAVKDTRRLRNGVEPERFVAPAPQIPAETPVIGYVGVLSPWMDFDLLLKLAGLRPEWQFVVAGPWYRMRPREELQRLANVDLRGPVAASDVPSLLAGFDVGLGLYRQEPWLDVDSMKLHEYLAAGLATVSTPCHPYLSEDFEDLVRVAEDAASFDVEIDRILRRSEDQRRRFLERCHDFANRHSWQVRTSEALAVLKGNVSSLGAPRDGR